MSVAATVLISTKNRKDDLRVAVASALRQEPAVEVLVIDDGSTDGTGEMLAAEFPSVRVHRSEVSRGYIVQRNLGARLASAPVVVSIDDDAEFPSPHTVAQTLAEFDHPRIGAVAIPFINVNYSPEVHQRAPDDGRRHVIHSYVGTAHALRRDVFLAVGGYREALVHQGEEGDLSIRLLDAGYVVRLGRADPIHHFESPKRDRSRMDYYGKRNLVLYTWFNVPLPFLPLHLAATTAKGALHGVRCGRPRKSLEGLLHGYRDLPAQLAERHPVASATYRLNRKLKRGSLPLEEVERLLQPLPAAPEVARA